MHFVNALSKYKKVARKKRVINYPDSWMIDKETRIYPTITSGTLSDKTDESSFIPSTEQWDKFRKIIDKDGKITQNNFNDLIHKLIKLKGICLF